MNKPFWKSKTLWGVAIATVVGVGQVLGVGYSETVVAQVVEVLGYALGAWGFRDAMPKK